MPARTLSEQEYNAVRDSVLASAPPNLDEATFTRWIGPQLAAAIAEAELRPPAPEGSALRRFAGGAAEMLNPVTMVKGVVGAVVPEAFGGTGPVSTVRTIGQQMGEQWGKAREAASKGRYSEAVGHAAAGSIPLIGPTAAAIGEQAAEGDIAGAAGATSGLIAPGLVRPAIRATRAVAPTGLRATIAERLESGAASRVAEVMTPKVGANKTRLGGMAETIAPELASRPELAAWSRTGFETKVGHAFEAATTKLDEASNARLSARTFTTQPIINALKKARQRWIAEPVEASKYPPRRDVIVAGDAKPTRVELHPEKFGEDVIPPENAARVARIDQAIADLEQLGSAARYEPLRRIREAADQSARIKYAPSVTQDFLKRSGEASGAADVAGVLREHLAKFDPQTATANAEYALLRKATDVLEAVAETERTRPKVGRQIMARLTGTVAGGEAAGFKGAVAGYVLGPVVEAAMSGAPTTKLQTARLMTQMADAIRRGHVTRAYSLAEQMKRAVKLSGGLAARATASGGLAPTAAVSPQSP